MVTLTHQLQFFLKFNPLSNELFHAVVQRYDTAEAPFPNWLPSLLKNVLIDVQHLHIDDESTQQDFVGNH